MRIEIPPSTIMSECRKATAKQDVALDALPKNLRWWQVSQKIKLKEDREAIQRQCENDIRWACTAGLVSAGLPAPSWKR